jgi:RNA-directed DNA polymerase
VILERLGLTLHPEKTRVVFVGDGRQGFDFLGFHHRKVASWRWRGKRYLQRWPSRRAMQRIRDRVKAITAPRQRLWQPVETLVDELNGVLRGWGAYFRVGNTTAKFQQIDQYVRQRLGLFLNKKAGRRGHNWRRCSTAYVQKLGLHQLTGTVAWYGATPRAAR